MYSALASIASQTSVSFGQSTFLTREELAARVQLSMNFYAYGQLPVFEPVVPLNILHLTSSAIAIATLSLDIFQLLPQWYDLCM